MSMPELGYGGNPETGYTEIGHLQMNAVNLRIGKMQNQDGETVGIILEVWFVPLPWFKIRIPFGRVEARDLVTRIERELGEQLPELEGS